MIHLSPCDSENNNLLKLWNQTMFLILYQHWFVYSRFLITSLKCFVIRGGVHRSCHGFKPIFILVLEEASSAWRFYTLSALIAADALIVIGCFSRRIVWSMKRTPARQPRSLWPHRWCSRCVCGLSDDTPPNTEENKRRRSHCSCMMSILFQ